MNESTVTQSAEQALSILRDGSQFQWYVIPLLLLVMYVYAQQASQGRWSVLLGGLAFWLMDWVNEIWNGLVFYFSGYAPVWGAPDDTAFLILIGLNVEIMLMFAVMGVTAMLTLPPDPQARILGVNNRWIWAAGNSAAAVAIEIWLNHIGALTWEWAYWRTGFPWLIFLIGYMPFFVVGAWVHDMQSRARQLVVVGGLGLSVTASLLLFIPVLGWL